MQENMFKFGDKNLDVTADFLEYSRFLSTESMCYGLNTPEAVEFLKKQAPFIDCDIYPVEHAVLQHEKKENIYKSRDVYYGECYEEYTAPNSCDHSCGKLRIWWAYNLAIAASQGKM